MRRYFVILLSFLMASNPISKNQAVEIARKAVAELSVRHDYTLMLDRTEEREFGWVFFYAPRQYLQTGDRKYLVPGTAPFVVLRADGTVEHLATSIPPARAVDIYEEMWREKETTKTRD